MVLPIHKGDYRKLPDEDGTLDALRRRADMLNASGRDTAEVLDRARVGEELATDRYHGGLVITRAGGLHPARYVQGLAEAARRHLPAVPRRGDG